MVLTNKTNESRRLAFYCLDGTNYEYSYKLGQLTKERIRERIAKDTKDLQPLFKFIKTTDGSNYLDSYTTTIQNTLPWYYDELKGISDGSGIPLEQILVLNFKNELKAAKDLSVKKEDNEELQTSCSTVLINRLDQGEQQLYISHNEDESDANWNTSYIVQATIRSSSYKVGDQQETKESPSERFIAFGYAGQIPGGAFAANHHGFVFTHNGLYPKVPLREGALPRQIHNRSILAIENEEKLTDVMKNLVTAYGFNLNVGHFRYTEPTQQKYLWSYELAPSNDGGKTNQFNINYTFNERQIIDSEICKNKSDIMSSSFTLNFYCHFNHYVHLKAIDQTDEPLASSFMRAKRASEFNDIKSLDQALEFLGDEKYASEHPLYRASSTGQTNSVTLCTAVFDLNKATFHVYDDNPAPSKSSPCFQFDLNTL